ncbi:PREDICTED: uncharacterized protein LOC107348646 [Acropora digitifera]|uniref:uncharacterized protein LOC107348646 n=1 Tax=Acropora digitifera TaxID=70779 RepID=UPI00077ABE71|nr:PREDICTED: uncharacterized protein LOC107348646 [Acropora digitifera]
MASPAKKSRKPYFTASEISVLTEKYEENMEILQSKFTNSVTNAKKNLVWEDIASAVNAVGVALRTTQEIKDKWKNLQSTAKKEFTAENADEATATEVESTHLSAPVDADELEEVTEVAVENAIVPSNKKPKDLNRKTRKITQDQVLQEQYKALVLKQEKLELEVTLLEGKIKGDSNGILTTINLSPIVASRPFLS